VGPATTPTNDVVANGTMAPRHVPTVTTTETTPSRDINTATLCRVGQETVQDIISRTQEVFTTLKTIQVNVVVVKVQGGILS